MVSMATTATESRVALSVQRRKELAAIKEAQGYPNYDTTLKELIENFDPDEGE